MLADISNHKVPLIRMKRTVYCAVKMRRGTGFGNRLFPWARAKAFSHLHSIPMLAPGWVQPRIRQFFRGGTDLKAYHRQLLLIGLFGKKGYIRGIPRFLLLRRACLTSEPANLTIVPDHEAKGPVVIVFEGDKNHFADLRGMRGFLLRTLRSETRPKWVELADKTARPIAVNVRCGNDFKAAASSSDYFTKGAVKTPLNWFVASLLMIRKICEYDIPAVVVSDGTREQLVPLLTLPNVTFARPGCAISDLLTLANAKVIIGSGGSSFSAWGAFLSGAPTITHPGQSLQWFKVNDGESPYVGEFDPACGPDQGLTKDLASIFAAGRRS